MSDYIKREDAIKVIVDYAVPQMYFPNGGDLEAVGECAKRVLNNAPSQDVAPIRHGHWVFNQDEMSLHCSYCDEVFRFEDAEKDECLDFMEYAKYCLACGTRMDGDEDDD